MNNSQIPPAIAQGFLDDPTDLSELKIISPKKVKAFVHAINDTQNQNLGDRKIVAAIGTGGTISMKTENNVCIPEQNFDTILAQINTNVSNRFKIISLDAFLIDSSQMTYAHVRDLAITLCYCWKHVKPNLLGFMILHGTDTLPYASSALSLIMGQGLPFSVIYTAAQKSIQEPMTDADTNLRNALYTLESLHKHNMAEIITVMGNRAHLSTSAVKTEDRLADAFDSPLHKFITTFSSLAYPIELPTWLNPKRQIPFNPTIWYGDYGHTLIIQSHMGTNPHIFAEQINSPHIRAIVFFSYGAGTVEEAMADIVIKSAKKKNCPVFIVSPINARYRISYKSAQNIIKKGAIPLYMTLPSALAKIEIALRQSPNDIQAISRFMTTNYVGEIPDENSHFKAIYKR